MVRIEERENMKILKSTTWILVIIMLIISMYGLSFGLPLLVFFLGAKEFISAREFYDDNKYKLAMASAIIGIFACICAIVSIINII